jgi:hypothetical protein
MSAVGVLRIRWIYWTRRYRCNWFHRAWHRVEEDGRHAECRYCGSWWVRR